MKDNSQRIAELAKLKHSNQSAFDRNTKLTTERDKLNKAQENYVKSADRARHLDNIGITNTPQNNQKVVDHFLNVGQKVTKNSLEQTSYIKGPTGKLKVISNWSIHPNGKAYLGSARFIPVSQ